MSHYLNHVHLIGFVGSDAEVSQNNGPTRVSVATKTFWKDEKDQWQSRAEWHSVVAWNGTAKLVAQLKKGQHVRIVGELRSREYDGDGGVKHKTYEIVASEIHGLRPERPEGNEPQ